MVLGAWLDAMILDVFSNLCFYDSIKTETYVNYTAYQQSHHFIAFSAFQSVALCFQLSQ